MAVRNTLNTLRVNGYAKLAAEPDLARLDISLTVQADDYPNAIMALAAKAKAVRAGLNGRFVDTRKMRTGEFLIEPSGTAQSDHHAGRCVMTLQGTLKQNWLDLVLDALAESAPDVQVELQFGLQDPEALRQRVLVKAVAEARRSAEVLARAAGVQLGPVSSMSYDETVHNAEISSPKIIIPLDVEVNISDFGLVPAEYGDGVTVIWELGDPD